MPTTPSSRGISRDRATVAASQPREVDYFARKHGLTRDQVQQLIREVGNDRKTLEAAVSRMKGPSPQ